VNRIERRRRYNDARRKRPVDPVVSSRERSVRTRAARRIRTALSRMEPVVLVAPRWSDPRQFLDDLALDLTLTTGLPCRTFSFQALQGRSVHEAWTWVLHGIAEFCGVSLDGPAAQAVTGRGFRTAVGDVLKRAMDGPQRVLLLHNVEHLLVEARDDLFRAFEAHAAEHGPDRKVNMLFCGSVDAPSFAVAGAVRHVLPDYGPDEAANALIDEGASMSDDAIRQAIGLVGGVPALLRELGRSSEKSPLDPTEDTVLRAIGSLNDEIRGAVAIVSAVDGLADRLELIASAGAQRMEPKWDAILMRSGLIRHADGPPGFVALRAPIFVRLASMAYG